ncbi:MBL fold metallo-hydrolase [Comamonas composti]|uniref:MBL fold metallo-hydrolase n=1 Tax=Comamonas composti TaxID=408558 RepID=UPI00041CF1CC|nr:MBL fold metallo-hydrolase [Comamonas composti]
MTASNESTLHYSLGERLPGPAQTLEIAPGVKWIRMSLPFALDHINLWLLRDRQQDIHGQTREGWTVVDCCVNRSEARAQWEQIFATQLEGLPILRVIVTHMHPDHIGLAGWLCEHWQAPLWISSTDYNVALVAMKDRDGFGGESGADFYKLHGQTDAQFLAHVRGRGSYYPSLVSPLPSTYHRIIDGMEVEINGHAWQCIAGYGHAPEHIALYCPELNILISGDMVLPRISANVSVHAAEPEANPLQLFLSSLERYFALPEDTQVLPSHGKPFTGLHLRVQQLIDHHHERLNDIMQAAQAEALSAANILDVLFKRQLDSHQMTFAMGEALAHLHYLWFAKQLVRKADEHGVLRFYLPQT